MVAAWALGGLYASLGPSLIAEVFGIDNHLVGGLLILALNGTGIAGSLALRTAPPARARFLSTIAARIITERRPMMSARRPAKNAPTAQPISSEPTVKPRLASLRPNSCLRPSCVPLTAPLS